MSGILEISRLTVTLPTPDRPKPVLSDVSLSIAEGQAVGLVGESGSGKSMTARSIVRLLPPGARVEGAIRYQGTDVGGLRGAALRELRAGVPMIFQDPRAHINPVRTIGDFLTEALRIRGRVGRRQAEQRAVRVLGEVGIADGGRRLRQYPHELSGGLLQRVMIAATLLAEPKLLLADEPTTALDVTTQAEVMAVLDELRRERGLAMLFITHDLELAAAVCDRTAVMYAGRVMEVRASAALHDDPLHPYTAALTAARPSLERRADRLATIPGRPLSAFEAPDGCVFCERCPHVREGCRTRRPELRPMSDGEVACLRAEELQAASHG
ncbi:ABC transporter ATP-binding protein [Spongiactinospora gelatinilytica]|uniref:ABC transporter ATP-binding protein n=1 Tax=Spongiactinospora gelatinilytica TaxID=2666298 RepID=A0A2W2HSH4_9ACTN|nr:ABC transporter ATP-binding protein [Spongiactinospora gelatinilytica]PZG52818.1 ABC transporter ATP-binding protein [Spongiactinospora gelatinilytica]